MIVCKNVTKKYGDAVVLNDVSIEFPRGKITGLIGRNGSGKSVLLRSICGLIPPTSGHIWVNGKEIRKDIPVPESLGALIEAPGFLPHCSGYGNLKRLAKIKNVIGREEIFRAMERVELDPKSRKWVGKYSSGMRQRLGIAQAFMENPDLLILDEPMSNLDNHSVLEMRTLFKQLNEEGKTIIITSHDSTDIEQLCDAVYIMENGVCRKVEAK